jgi:hypothetical protein
MLADTLSALTATRLRGQALADYPPPVWSLDALEAARAGRPVAIGLRAAETRGNDAGGDHARGRRATDVSLYDVAPVLGPGARPFVAGHDQGTPLPGDPVPLVEWLKPLLPPGHEKPTPAQLAQADARLELFMPHGVLLRVDLDEEFWLNFGLGETATVWFGNRETFVAKPPIEVSARFANIERLQLGGLLWPEAAARIADTAYATRESIGRGQVILFADQPAFRRWMKESERMLINAVLLGPGLGARWSTPW